jgi:hypothetical protein
MPVSQSCDIVGAKADQSIAVFDVSFSNRSGSVREMRARSSVSASGQRVISQSVRPQPTHHCVRLSN